VSVPADEEKTPLVPHGPAGSCAVTVDDASGEAKAMTAPTDSVKINRLRKVLIGFTLP
jgi:hypothetical protein